MEFLSEANPISAVLQGAAPDEIPETGGLEPPVLDESSVAALDTAAQSPGFDLDLLRTTPARDMRIQIEATVALLEQMDHRAVLSKRGFLSRLTGADVEARLEFELASQRVLVKVQQLRQSGQNARRVGTLLKKARNELESEQSRLEQVISKAKLLLSASSGADDFVVARFERRLSNIMAMHAANILTIRQIILAEDVLTGILDRFTDFETLLLPLWQRNVLALAHTSGGRARQAVANDFAQSHRALISFLKQDNT